MYRQYHYFNQCCTKDKADKILKLFIKCSIITLINYYNIVQLTHEQTAAPEKIIIILITIIIHVHEVVYMYLPIECPINMNSFHSNPIIVDEKNKRNETTTVTLRLRSGQ